MQIPNVYPPYKQLQPHHALRGQIIQLIMGRGVAILLHNYQIAFLLF
jgi:hypothetical protein